MKLVFLVRRVNYYKFFYSTIQEAILRGNEVECWHNAGDKKVKGALSPGAEGTPCFDAPTQPRIRTFTSSEELDRLLLGDDSIDFVITLMRPETEFGESLLVQVKFKWVVLMGTGPDSFMALNGLKKMPPALPRPGYFFTASDDWKDRGGRFLKDVFPDLMGLMGERYIETKSVGQPEFDVCAGIEPEKVRQKYGIPQGKKIFLYLPFPYYVHSGGSQWARAFCGLYTKNTRSGGGKGGASFFVDAVGNGIRWIYNVCRVLGDPLARDWWLRGINEVRVIEAIKAFCVKNDLFLVVKPRMKFPVAEAVEKAADLMMWDTEVEHNPSALKELLSVSRLSASYFSHAVLTSVFLNVFHLNLIQPRGAFPGSDPSGRPSWFTYWLPDTRPSIFAFDKVCDSWAIKDVIEKLPQTPIEDLTVDQGRRAEYVKKFIGFDDFESCKRILDVLENDAKQKML